MFSHYDCKITLNCTETAEDLIVRVANLSANVTSLNLSWNNLCRFSEKELGDIFSNLPPKLRLLNLSTNINLFNKFSADAIYTLLCKLPKTLTTIDLSGNNLGSLSIVQLCALLSNLPDNIIKIDLSGNMFANLSHNDIEAVSSGLNSHPNAEKLTLTLINNNISARQQDLWRVFLNVLINIIFLPLAIANNSWFHPANKKPISLEEQLESCCQRDENASIRI